MSQLVISQGPLTYYDQVEAAWNIPILHSTWADQPEKRFSLRSKRPDHPGKQNVWLQQQSTLAGLKWAKEHGFERVIKCRSDLVPNSERVLDLLDGELNFLFFHNYKSKYVVDYLQAGDTQTLIDIWSFDYEPDFPEQAITNNLKKLGLVDKIKFIGGELTPENDLYWLKNDLYLSTYKKDPLYLTEWRS